MSYRVCSQAATVVLHSILAAREVTADVVPQEWNLVRYVMVNEPLDRAYLSSCYTVIKSLLKCQDAVDVKLQIMERDVVFEEWLLVVSKDYDAQEHRELQAVLDQIQASASFLPSVPVGATCRVFVAVTAGVNMPSQCTKVSVPSGSGHQTQFRHVGGLRVEHTGYQ